MPMQLVITETPKKSKKRLRSVWRLHAGGPVIKIVDFCLKGGSTYLDHKDKTKRKNYIARHSVNEKQFYKDPMRAATLSRFILWGEKTKLEDSIKDYKKKFNLS